MKLHMILIGIVLLGLVSTGLAVFISSGSSHYSIDGYDNASLETFDRMTELNGLVEDFNDDSGVVGSDSDDDKLGSLFTSTYQSAGILKNSVGILGGMVDDGVSNVGILGGFAKPLKVALTSIVLISLFVGVFMAFITKSDRT